MKPAPRKKFSIEYIIRSSPVILFEFLTQPTGLVQWFADRVNVLKNLYTFSWEGNVQKAKVLELIENQLIRFQWLDSPPDEYFEFKISATEITGDTVLEITDFADPKELKDAQKLWDSQIHELKVHLGVL